MNTLAYFLAAILFLWVGFSGPMGDFTPAQFIAIGLAIFALGHVLP